MYRAENKGVSVYNDASFYLLTPQTQIWGVIMMVHIFENFSKTYFLGVQEISSSFT